MRFLPLVLKNLLRKKTRSGLTVGSILLPFFVICILGTFVAMLDADPSQGRGMYRLAVRHRVSFTNVLPASHLEKIRQLPGVKAATPFNWFGGRYVDFSAFNVFERFAVDPPAFFGVFDPEAIVQGSAEAWQHDRSGLLVGELLIRKYGWRLGQQISLSSATSGRASTRSRSGPSTEVTTRPPSSSTRRSSTRPCPPARAATR